MESGLVFGVVIGPDEAVELAVVFRRMLRDRERRDGVKVSPELWARCIEIEELARDRRGVAVGVVATTVETLRPGMVENMNEITVAEMADRMGVKPQAVTARCRRRTLPARKDCQGRWLIQIEDEEPA